jgi:hypothetical protein
MRSPKNARREARTRRVVHVQWINRESDATPAELLDVSPAGLFITPTGAVPESIGKGDRVWIVFKEAAGDRTLMGTVRWRGYSQTHDAIGFGVELEPGSRELATKVLDI